MKLIELFAGSRSIGRVAARRGWQVCSVDLKPFPGIDLVADINDVDVRDFPFVPDAIWASPPCTFFSIAGAHKFWRHWEHSNEPISEDAIGGIRNVISTLRIIRFFTTCNPRLVYYLENPRGKLRQLPLLSHLPRATVTYCKYGAPVMKPTDIWTNNLGRWRPRAMCFAGNPDCHHEQCSAPVKCGVTRQRNAYERSKIPSALAREVLDAVKKPKMA